MNLEKFKELDEQKLQTISGGFWQLAALAFPFVMQALAQTVASFKMITSDSGAIKYQGYESKWEDNGPTKSSSKSTDSSVKQIVYAY